MQVTIHGPNLNDQTKGTFHVHTADCRDNAKEVRVNGSRYPVTVGVETVEDAVEVMYADHIKQGEMTVEDGVADFHFAPCTRNLPNR